MAFNPASRVQDYLVFGEFGDVNPSITDSSTYTFLSPERMEELFEHEIEGCFLYSRHFNPTNKYLASALERMEDGESAQVMASGMGAISTTLMTLCGAGDEIVCGRSIYGGTYALLKNLLPRFGVNTRFVDLGDHDAVRAAMTPQTRVLYCESLSNPLLEVADLPALAAIAHEHGAQAGGRQHLHADDPVTIAPWRRHCRAQPDQVRQWHQRLRRRLRRRFARLHFPPHRHQRRAKHAARAGARQHPRSEHPEESAQPAHPPAPARRQRPVRVQPARRAGIRRALPGPGQPSAQHQLLTQLMNPGYGYGGMLTLDAGDLAAANRLMTLMQRDKVGYLAVSLGYFKTLFNTPGHSTSSEIPPAEREAAGLREGLIRFSIGLDEDIAQTTARIENCLSEAEVRGSL
jgi:methionine-gamma-lyase